MLTLYNAILAPARVAAQAMSVWQSRNPEMRTEWRERLARALPEVPPGGIWLHGASVGETRIVTQVAEALRKDCPARPLCTSALTRTGRAQLPSTPLVDASFFAPLDFLSSTARVLDAVRPALLGLVETELWPNLFEGAGKRSIPIVLLNGRLAPERMSRYRMLSPLYRPLLQGVTAIGVQSEANAERFVSLGVARSKIVITGNIKYDLPAPEVDRQALRRELHVASDRPIFVAGSTAEGEDSAVLEAYQQARQACPGLLLIIAPRHPHRSDAVEALVEDAGLSVSRLSKLEAAPKPIDVLLVDSIGRLSEFYAIAQVAFVGGSLVPVGGHNVLEPASAGVPVLFGRFTDHVPEPAIALEEYGGAVRVADGTHLGQVLSRLLTSESSLRAMGHKAAELVTTHQGAIRRSLDLIRSALNRASTSPSAK